MPDSLDTTKSTGRLHSMPLRHGRSLNFSNGPLVMGIINGTPDSFYADSRYQTADAGLECAQDMISEGADILDIGGESSRPGSDYVTAETEMNRVVPLIKEIRKISDIPVSVDTRKLAVAEAAINAGADIINDISGLRDDPELAGYLGSEEIPVVLMHMRGSPKTMQKNPAYDDVVSEIANELSEFIGNAVRQGISNDRIIVDPGIGFGKRMDDNLAIIRHSRAFSSLECPVLYGASRKSFIGTVTGREVGDRLAGSLAVAVYLALNGAQILRVHDVAATVDALKMTSAIQADGA